MKKKELRKLAEQIAQAEIDLQKLKDSGDVRELKEKIMKLCHRISSLEDIMLLDDMVQKKIKEKSS